MPIMREQTHVKTLRITWKQQETHTVKNVKNNYTKLLIKLPFDTWVRKNNRKIHNTCIIHNT